MDKNHLDPLENVESKKEHFISNGKSQKIEDSLIEECINLSEENKELYFIFDRIDDYQSNKKSEHGLYVDNIDGFQNYMSRWSYYDSLTRTSNQSSRYNTAYKYLTESIINSDNNLSVFEKKEILDPSKQVIFFDSRDMIRVILNPNLIIEISKIREDEIGTRECYTGFFDPKWITRILNKFMDINRLKNKPK